jgi:hypothetical protein
MTRREARAQLSWVTKYFEFVWFALALYSVFFSPDQPVFFVGAVIMWKLYCIDADNKTDHILTRNTGR